MFKLNRLIAFLALAVLLMGATSCFHKQLLYSTYNLESFQAESMEDRNVVYSGQTLRVSNQIGSIRVIGQRDPDFVALNQYVTIEAVKKVREIPFEELELEISVDDTEIVIEASGPSELGKRFKWTPPFIEDRMAFFDLTIRVPAGAEVFIEQELGQIELTNMGTESEKGQVEVSQFAGDITVSDSMFEYLGLEQEYGDITMTSTALDRGDIATGVGNVRAQFTRDESLRLNATTGLKEISLVGVADGDDGVRAVMDRTWPGQELQLLQWDGASRIEFETRIGNIEIEFVSP